MAARVRLLHGTAPMKGWSAIVCAAILASCAGPQVSVIDASPRQIGFLVQNAWLVPMQDMNEQAASHCGRRGLSYRRKEESWISPTLKRVVYECDGVEPLLPRKLAVRHPTRPERADPKVAAWTKTKAATDAWALCLRIDAERKAKETTEAPGAVAQEVVDACSGLEHAVHAQLEAVGEDSAQFHADLHEQAVQDAFKTAAGVRMKTAVPASGPTSILTDSGNWSGDAAPVAE